MKTLVMASALLGLLQPFVVSPALALPVSERTYTANEAYLISSLSYQSSAARAALSRQFDSKFSDQKRLIDSKDAALGRAQGLLKRSKADAAIAKVEIAKLEQEITSLKTDFLAQLSQKDADFARERVALEEDAKNLLRTPAGRQAMAVYLSSEPGAVKAGLFLFDQTAASRNEADKRRIAMLAYDSFQKGELTTEEILTRFEGVAPPERRTHIDWYMLAQLYPLLVQHDKARIAAEKALDTAGTEADRLDGLDMLGRVLLGNENISGALVQFQASEKLSATRLAKDPGNLQFQFAHASVLTSLGDAHFENRDEVIAYSRYVEANQIIGNLMKSDPNWPRVWESSLGNSIRIGRSLETQKDLDGALPHYRYALSLAQGLRSSFPQTVRYKDNLTNAHQRVGDLLRAKKDISGAIAEYNASHAIRLELYRADSAAYGPQNDLAQSFLRLGEVKAIQKDFRGALADYQEATKILRRVSDEDLKSRYKLDSLATALGRVANMQLETGNKKGAVAGYREALAIHQKLVKVDPSSLEYQKGVRIFLAHLVGLAPGYTWRRVLRQMEIMQSLSMIVGDDIEYMATVRAYVANE